MNAATRPLPLRQALLAAALFLASFAGSCLAPPVAERLTLELLPGGQVRATARVELAAEESDNPLVAARLREWRQSLLGAYDPWAQRFERLQPAEERFAWSKKAGNLVTAERSALLADPEGLVDLFADTPVSVSFTRQPGGAELAFYPGAASRATRAERRNVETKLATWSASLAKYLRAMDVLHAATEHDPARERACLTVLFGDADEAKEIALTDDEQRLVKAADEASSDIFDVLSVPSGEAFSLEELSRRVYDPFPADLELRIVGEVVSTEGFAATDPSVFTVPGLSLWRALSGLVARWPALAPFAQAAASAAVDENDAPLDIDIEALAADLARSEPPPDEIGVRRALGELLVPAPVYRVAWRFAPPRARGAPAAPR